MNKDIKDLFYNENWLCKTNYSSSMKWFFKIKIIYSTFHIFLHRLTFHLNENILIQFLIHSGGFLTFNVSIILFSIFIVHFPVHIPIEFLIFDIWFLHKGCLPKKMERFFSI